MNIQLWITVAVQKQRKAGQITSRCLYRNRERRVRSHHGVCRNRERRVRSHHGVCAETEKGGSDHNGDITVYVRKQRKAGHVRSEWEPSRCLCRNREGGSDQYRNRKCAQMPMAAGIIDEKFVKPNKHFPSSGHVNNDLRLQQLYCVLLAQLSS